MDVCLVWRQNWFFLALLLLLCRKGSTRSVLCTAPCCVVRVTSRWCCTWGHLDEGSSWSWTSRPQLRTKEDWSVFLTAFLMAHVNSFLLLFSSERRCLKGHGSRQQPVRSRKVSTPPPTYWGHFSALCSDTMTFVRMTRHVVLCCWALSCLLLGRSPASLAATPSYLILT